MVIEIGTKWIDTENDVVEVIAIKGDQIVFWIEKHNFADNINSLL